MLPIPWFLLLLWMVIRSAIVLRFVIRQDPVEEFVRLLAEAVTGSTLAGVNGIDFEVLQRVASQKDDPSGRRRAQEQLGILTDILHSFTGARGAVKRPGGI